MRDMDRCKLDGNCPWRESDQVCSSSSSPSDICGLPIFHVFSVPSPAFRKICISLSDPRIHTSNLLFFFFALPSYLIPKVHTQISLLNYFNMHAACMHAWRSRAGIKVYASSKRVNVSIDYHTCYFRGAAKPHKCCLNADIPALVLELVNQHWYPVICGTVSTICLASFWLSASILVNTSSNGTPELLSAATLYTSGA